MIRWRFLETVALDLKTETQEKGDVVQTNGCGFGALGCYLLTEGTTTPTVFRPGISIVALRAPLRRSVMSLTCSTFWWSFYLVYS